MVVTGKMIAWGQDSAGADGSSLEKKGKLESDYQHLRELFRPHVESFDYFIDAGLEIALMNIKPTEITDSSTGTKLRDILFFSLLVFYLSVLRPYSRSCSAPCFSLTRRVLWFGKPDLLSPEREGGRKSMREPVFPYEVSRLSGFFWIELFRFRSKVL